MAADKISSLTEKTHQQPRKMLGEIFVEQGLLTEISVLRLIEHAKDKKIRLGELLE